MEYVLEILYTTVHGIDFFFFILFFCPSATFCLLCEDGDRGEGGSNLIRLVPILMSGGVPHPFRLSSASHQSRQPLKQSVSLLLANVASNLNLTRLGRRSQFGRTACSGVLCAV